MRLLSQQVSRQSTARSLARVHLGRPTTFVCTASLFRMHVRPCKNHGCDTDLCRWGTPVHEWHIWHSVQLTFTVHAAVWARLRALESKPREKARRFHTGSEAVSSTPRSHSALRGAYTSCGLFPEEGLRSRGATETRS